MNPRFYFSVCQVGAEKAVKMEIATEFPHLKFAFSRPGFITFKEEDDRLPLIKRTHSVFTRLWGTSIGQAKTPEDLEALLLSLVKTMGQKSLKIHSFERDQFIPGDEPDAFVKNERIDEVVQALLEAIPGQPLQWNPVPKEGETIYDLVWLDDFHLFLGSHEHSALLDPTRGNQPQIDLPKDSPSRAYLKLAEAVHRFKPEVKAGTQVLEVGCSPGGATTAMLSWGFKVTGVDPKYMHESLYSKPNFTFIQKTAEFLATSDLHGTNPDWLVMDMNIAPLEALDQLGHVLDCLRDGWRAKLKLKMAFITLKLNDWKFSQHIPLYLKRLRELGFQDLTATQLCSNRQEFFVIAQRFRWDQPPVIRKTY